jgi:ribonucleoside-triphosphate reductase
VKQALQEFIFNLNVPTRVGFQTPFTNLSFDLTPPSYLRDEAVIIGKEAKDASYGEFQKEMDTLNRAFAEVMSEGDARGRIFTFPIPTYSITHGFILIIRIGTYLEIRPNTYPLFCQLRKHGNETRGCPHMCCRCDWMYERLNVGEGSSGSNPLTGHSMCILSTCLA